jgi:hydrogenase maturation protease
LRILVAGVGNLFLGDDAFGVEVVQQLLRSQDPLPARVIDAGIRGVHLAYELLDGYDALVLVDAMTHGEVPGTVSIFERGWEDEKGERTARRGGGAHDLDPESALALLEQLGGRVERIFTVGCEPEQMVERIGLSASVAAAVPPAVKAVRELIARLSAPAPVGATNESKREVTRCFADSSRPQS